MWIFLAFLLLPSGEIQRIERQVPTKQACVALMGSTGTDYRGLKPGTGRLASCTGLS